MRTQASRCFHAHRCTNANSSLYGVQIIFQTSNAKDYPLPDPYLLQIRALLTQVALPNAGGECLDYSSDEESLDLSVGYEDIGLKPRWHKYNRGLGKSEHMGEHCVCLLASNGDTKTEPAITRTKRWLAKLPQKRRRGTLHSDSDSEASSCEMETKRRRMMDMVIGENQRSRGGLSGDEWAF